METISYLPQEYINSNFLYTTDGDSILVRTNQNCYTQYNTIYCDCFYVYPRLDYLKSQVNQCSRNVSYTLSHNNFSSDWHRRIDAHNIILYASFYIILTIFIFITLLKVFRKALSL